MVNPKKPPGHEPGRIRAVCHACCGTGTFPDSPEMDMVWVAFVDDTRPIRQVSAAWLGTA